MPARTPSREDAAIDGELRINERIRVAQVRLVGADGEQIGIRPLAADLRMARELGLDLVEVALNADPPGVPGLGLREAQVRAGRESQGGAPPPEPRRQGDEAAAQDRQARPRHEVPPRRALPPRGEQGQGHVPRARARAPGHRAAAAAAPRRGHGHRRIRRDRGEHRGSQADHGARPTQDRTARRRPGPAETDGERA